jgi:hypothetical protein
MTRGKMVTTSEKESRFKRHDFLAFDTPRRIRRQLRESVAGAVM